MIFMVPWNWAPNGYQLCQGQTINLQQYEALYSLMGTVFGGNGTTTFLLPNLQGRAPVGTGQSPTGTFYTLAASGGSELTTLSVNNMPVHNHAASFTPTLGQQIVTIPATTGSLGVNVTINATSNLGANATPSTGASGNNMLSAAGYANAKVYGPTSTTNLVPLTGVSAGTTGSAGTAASTVTLNAVTGGSVAVGQSGSSQPFSTLQPFLAMSFVIAMNGLYPDRP
jgi:microcystin-dependent protein